MTDTRQTLRVFLYLILLFAAGGCSLPEEPPLPEAAIATTPRVTATSVPLPTPFPTRPKYGPGELVDYTAQTGDTVSALARRFNTTIPEILAANPIIPADATTMPPGMPMAIPIYYLPLWGTPMRLIPDWHFANGPAAVQFDTQAFVDSQPGWLKDHIAYVGGRNRSGAGVVDYVALNFSISPRLLLALLEYQAGALSQPTPPSNVDGYVLGYENVRNRGVYLQLVWAANRLNNGFYAHRQGDLVEFELLDGRLERPDPWQNAGTVAIHYYFSSLLEPPAYQWAISSEGLGAVLQNLYGDLWEIDEPHIPGSLTQPNLRLPFEDLKPWTYTGGPHTGWGNGRPLAALDFAPPSERAGCFESNEWATAVADGLVVRSDTGLAVLDLDKDGDERTGWVIFYLHLATKDRAPVGAELSAGDPIGHPSCEGGTSTGSHVHIARKYNGEWIPAEGALAFNLDGWVARNGDSPYQGFLVRGNQVVTACECSNLTSQIVAGR